MVDTKEIKEIETMIKETIITLTIGQLCELRSNIVLSQKTNTEHWSEPQCAYYVLRLLLGRMLPQETIPLYPQTEINDFTFSTLFDSIFTTTALGSEELIALYKYVGVAEFASKQYDLKKAYEWQDGGDIIQEIHEKTIEKEKGEIVHYPVYDDGLPLDNIFSELTEHNQQLIKNVHIPIRISHSKKF